jgi:DNA-binding NarL/FixJ family response regulator
LTRTEIAANTLRTAEEFARALAGDAQIEVVRTTVAIPGVQRFSGRADVLTAINIGLAAVRPSPIPVVLVSNRPAAPFVESPVRAWLPIESRIEDIASAIKAAALDLYVFSAQQARGWIRVPADLDNGGAPVEELTAREKQVLAMIADGLANKEIASLLRISENTVKYHVAQLLAKLDASTRTEAVGIGIRRGLITI